MIVHSYYEEDPRVRREAEALVAHGWDVDVLALRNGDAPERETISGVNVRRLPVGRHQGAGLFTYLWEYGVFLLRSLFAATAAHRRRRYGLAQVHNLPDYLVFAALPLKLVRVPVLLDFHEPSPEFFRGRFARASNRLTYRLLLLQERMSMAVATELLTVNEPVAELFRKRGAKPARLTVVMNSPDLRLFDPSAHPVREFMADGVLRLVYAGGITPTYELDIVLRAIAVIRRERPNVRLMATFYGRGDSEQPLRELADELGISDCLQMPGRIPLDKVAAEVAASDIGVAATKRDSYSHLCISTKAFEYGAMRKPVVATRLETAELYFGQDSIYLYEPGDAESLARAIMRLMDDPAERAARVERTMTRVRELAWERQAEAYLGVVKRLTHTA